MNNFGEKIKILRTRKKLKQDDIASVLNLSRAQISNLEAGRRNVTLKQLKKLCEYFKVDITYFMLSENTDECLDLFIEKLQYEAKSNKYLNDLKNQDNYEEIKSSLVPNNMNMIVTPKEVDDLIENMKDVVARSINYAI